MGDHFIVVQGKTEMLKNGGVTSTTFNYYNPGTINRNKGTSSSNLLRIENERLIDKKNNGITFIVTSIRPSR